MIDVTGLDHLVLTVADVEATCAFYTRVLGMERRTFGDGRVALHFGDQKFNLHPADAIPDPNVRHATPGSVDICLRSSSGLADVEAHLADCGVPVVEGRGRRTGATGAIESVYVYDPDENLVEIAVPVDSPVPSEQYGRFAPYYDALHETIGKDAGREVAAVLDLLGEQGVPTGSLLDVACGTGRHLARFQEHIEDVAGADLSAELLEVAGQRLPSVPLHRADFRDLDLGRTFDVVTCLFSSIGHVDDEDDLDRAVGAMASHVGRGGALVIEPWLTPELVVDEGMRSTAGVEVDDVAISRTARSWVEDDVVELDWLWALATPEGIETLRERLRLPVFTRERHLQAMTAAGLDATWHDDLPTCPRGLVVGRREDEP